MPKEVFEIVFHARAGQGAKSAAQLIVEAALEEKKHIQSFPEYGPERSGAPMRAFARISKKPIKTYATIENPDAIVVIDPSLLSPELVKDINKDGILLVNTCEPIDWIRKKTGYKGKTYTVDGTGISIELLGKDLPNTTVLGALVKATNIVELKSLTDRVKKFYLEKQKNELAQANANALKRGYAGAKNE
ncbi:MAG: 2-oxoacid:acceptor oxidoreductase family protein [archaeon]